MALLTIDTDYLKSFLSGLLNTSGSTGFAKPGTAFTEQAFVALPELELEHTRKGVWVAICHGGKSTAPCA